MGEMRVLSGKGDTKVIWDPSNDDEVDAAKAQFELLMEKGFKIFKVGKDHKETGGALKKFPKRSGKLIAIPRIVGG